MSTAPNTASSSAADAALDATSDAASGAAAHADAATRPTSGLRAAARIAIKGGAVLLATLATVFAITFYVPETTDYVRATTLKHDLLTAPAGKKIVLVGGSNLAFGIDSALIREATNCPVANMGMNGYLGVRFMLNEVAPDMRAGDVVVIAFEHDNYFKSVNGAAADFLWLAKTNPRIIPRLTWEQRLAALQTIPLAAQSKIFRLTEEAYDALAADEGETEELDLIRDIESFSGFNADGDLTSHLGVAWTADRELGITEPPMDPQAIDEIDGFAARMNARGVHVMMSYSPLARSYYDAHTDTMEAVNDRVVEAPNLVAPSALSDYVFDDALFFDTVYHLNAEGRRLRTEKLVADLERSLQDDAMCR